MSRPKISKLLELWLRQILVGKAGGPDPKMSTLFDEGQSVDPLDVQMPDLLVWRLPDSNISQGAALWFPPI